VPSGVQKSLRRTICVQPFKNKTTYTNFVQSSCLQFEWRNILFIKSIMGFRNKRCKTVVLLDAYSNFKIKIVYKVISTEFRLNYLEEETIIFCCYYYCGLLDHLSRKRYIITDVTKFKLNQITSFSICCSIDLHEVNVKINIQTSNSTLLVIFINKCN
jgi:hypothetical protein